MGGIIIIDFIDMELREHRHRVHQALEDALRRDKAKTDVLSVSSIGVVEMTRQRMGRSLEAMTFQECPYCKGEGHIKSVSTVCIELFRELKKILSESKMRNMEISVHPDVANFLATQNKPLVNFIERHYRCRLSIKPDPTRHIEDRHIVPT
jgi:ribonuclease G